MTIHMRLGQFAIVDREPVDRGPNAGAFHGKGPVHDRAELYVLAEANSHAGEVFAGHVVSSLGQTWRSLDMSLTGSLREIYRTADADVREWNAKSLDEHQLEIGLTCLATRGDQVVVAVGGPAVAFHSSADGCVAHFPDEEHAAPLGSGQVSPVITRISFNPGDRLLMLSSSVLGEVDPNLLADILRLEPERALREIYHHVTRMRDVTVVLAVAEEAGEGNGSTFSVDIVDIAAEAVIDATRKPDVTGPSLVADDRAAREEDSRAAAARREMQGLESRTRERLSVPSDYVVAPTPLRRVSGEASAERLAAAGRAAAAGVRGVPESSTRSRSFSRGLVRAPVPPPPARSDVPLAEDVAREVVARQSQRARTESENAIAPGGPASRTLVRPREGAGGRMRGSGTLARSGHTLFHVPSWIIALAGVFALFALIGAFTLPGLLREQEAGRYLTLMEQAEQHRTNAAVMEDAAQRRDALNNARALLIEAQGVDGAGPEAAELLSLVEDAIAEMDAIVTPGAVEEIANLTEFGTAPVTSSHLTVSGNSLYLLDGNGQQVIAVDLTTGDPRSVYARTAEGGADSRPVAIAAGVDPAVESVLVADIGQQLWSYSSGTGVRALDLALPDGGDIADIATFGGSLYVLDAANAAVYRYLPSSTGFSQRETVLNTPALAAARRLLVNGDEIITTDADGTLHWFSGEIAVDLSLAGIDQPLASPEPVSVLGDSGEYAVADPAQKRVVIFRRDGSFARQYVAPQFEALQGLFVAGGTSYVYSGGILYEVTWAGE